MILKIKKFRLLKNYEIEIEFNNNQTLTVDLKNEFQGEVFEPLKDLNFFQQAYLTEWNVIEWPNGADFAPEYLFSIGQKAA